MLASRCLAQALATGNHIVSASICINHFMYSSEPTLFHNSNTSEDVVVNLPVHVEGLARGSLFDLPLHIITTNLFWRVSRSSRTNAVTSSLTYIYQGWAQNCILSLPLVTWFLCYTYDSLSSPWCMALNIGYTWPHDVMTGVCSALRNHIVFFGG